VQQAQHVSATATGVHTSVCAPHSATVQQCYAPWTAGTFRHSKREMVQAAGTLGALCPTCCTSLQRLAKHAAVTEAMKGGGSTLPGWLMPAPLT
jgi:hypothetical protein